MPSPEHEAPIDLLRVRPSLVATLLRDLLGVTVPAHTAVRVGSGEFTDLPQYRPDLAVSFEEQPDRVSLAVAIEVQRAVDDDKPFRWPLYAAVLRARFRSPSAVLVLAESEPVARWARRPILDLQPGSVFKPLVLGPAEIPVILSVEVARESPELAVLSAMVHWREHRDTLLPVTSALQAASELPPALGRVYSDLAVTLLDRAGIETLRKIMTTQTWYKSQFARELAAELAAEARQEAREEGRTEGRKEGRTEGKHDGLREALHAILTARRIELTPAQRDRVAASADDAQLDRWIERAATATSAEGIFD